MDAPREKHFSRVSTNWFAENVNSIVNFEYSLHVSIGFKLVKAIKKAEKWQINDRFGLCVNFAGSASLLVHGDASRHFKVGTVKFSSPGLFTIKGAHPQSKFREVISGSGFGMTKSDPGFFRVKAVGMEGKPRYFSPLTCTLAGQYFAPRSGWDIQRDWHRR